MNNLECLNVMTWGRCNYLHIDKLKIMADMIKAKIETPDHICQLLNTTPGEKAAYCKAIRFHLITPSAEEIRQVEFLQQRRRDRTEQQGSIPMQGILAR